MYLKCDGIHLNNTKKSFLNNCTCPIYFKKPPFAKQINIEEKRQRGRPSKKSIISHLKLLFT